jgi:hypothetical protein
MPGNDLHGVLQDEGFLLYLERSSLEILHFLSANLTDNQMST